MGLRRQNEDCLGLRVLDCQLVVFCVLQVPPICTVGWFHSRLYANVHHCSTLRRIPHVWFLRHVEHSKMCDFFFFSATIIIVTRKQQNNLSCATASNYWTVAPRRMAIKYKAREFSIATELTERLTPGGGCHIAAVIPPLLYSSH